MRVVVVVGVERGKNAAAADGGCIASSLSATATAVGLGATPVLRIAVDADTDALSCREERGSEFGGKRGEIEPLPPPSPPSSIVVVARLHAASVAASTVTRVASACAGDTALSSRRREPRSSVPIDSESQLSQGGGRDMVEGKQGKERKRGK